MIPPSFTPSNNPLLTEPEAAEFCTLTHNTMRIYRYQNRGPKYCRLGTWKGIRYRLNDLQEWLKSRESK